jgi:hypothetical protein
MNTLANILCIAFTLIVIAVDVMALSWLVPWRKNNNPADYEPRH